MLLLGRLCWSLFPVPLFCKVKCLEFRFHFCFCAGFAQFAFICLVFLFSLFLFHNEQSQFHVSSGYTHEKQLKEKLSLAVLLHVWCHVYLTRGVKCQISHKWIVSAFSCKLFVVSLCFIQKHQCYYVRTWIFFFIYKYKYYCCIIGVVIDIKDVMFLLSILFHGLFFVQMKAIFSFLYGCMRACVCVCVYARARVHVWMSEWMNNSCHCFSSTFVHVESSLQTHTLVFPLLWRWKTVSATIKWH